MVCRDPTLLVYPHEVDPCGTEVGSLDANSYFR